MNAGRGHTVAPDLNPAQRQAVLYLDGPCLVLAGAGSGKTRVITQKIAYLLRECAYPANRVVALTFTNKAAREMSDRVRQLVDARMAKGLTVSTFHSLGLRFLREEAEHAGLKANFSILDSNDALAIIQELMATTDKARLRAVQQTISLWKNALMSPDDADKAAASPNDVEAARVYRNYSATLSAYQAVDFDDLIRLPATLMERNEQVRNRWQARVQYLLVDEYQDTNVCQYQLVRWLTGSRAMFTAVGDDAGKDNDRFARDARFPMRALPNPAPRGCPDHDHATPPDRARNIAARLAACTRYRVPRLPRSCPIAAWAQKWTSACPVPAWPAL